MSNSTRPQPTSMSAEAWEASVLAKQRRRQRQQSQQLQTIAVGAILVIAVIISVLIWLMAHPDKAPKTVSCGSYPQYCVPLAGGASVNANLEASSGRSLGESSRGEKDVVRYIDSTTVPTIGNPKAPIHFRVVSSYECAHCNAYHSDEIQQTIHDLVLGGQATLGYVLVNGSNASYTQIASESALCAGEQGAFWEMSDELFKMMRQDGIEAFMLETIRDKANSMGLDGEQLEDCVVSGRYRTPLKEHARFASDEGVYSTPTLLVSYDGVRWTLPSLNCYETIRQLTEQANEG